METLNIGRAKLTWLKGGLMNLDGGAVFGVVPKPLWSRKIPANELNQIEMSSDPILIQVDGKNILVDSGLGNNKFTEKQIRNFGILDESGVEKSLKNLNLSIDDIDIILMTHLHYDHANGLTKSTEEGYESIFKDIPIYASEVEWNEIKNPNIRSASTYWEMNWQPIVEQVKIFTDEIEILPGLKLIHTGGHCDGHSIILFEDENEGFIHMADIMPTHAHTNSLWVLAYDDYPMTSIYKKEKWIPYGIENELWFTFYHDAYLRAVKLDVKGKVKDELKRVRPEDK